MLAGLGLAVVVLGATPARAQGFGPDPFRPFNSQYDAYVYPIGPADGGAGAAAFPRGVSGANRFQDYLNQLQGAERAEIERYGIGMPYYRRSVDPSFDRDGKREYRPNRQSQRAFEDTQRLITDKYLDYFTERDPSKRVKLIRDYERVSREVGRALSTTREANPVDALDAATATLGASGRSRGTAGRAGADLPAATDSDRGALNRDRAGTPPSLRDRANSARGLRRSEVIPPAPRPGRRARRSADPEEALDRASRLRDLGPRPGVIVRDRRIAPDAPPSSSPED
jgi:hypothetical protein